MWVGIHPKTMKPIIDDAHDLDCQLRQMLPFIIEIIFKGYEPKN